MGSVLAPDPGNCIVRPVDVYGNGNTSTTDVVTIGRLWVGRGLLPHDAK